MIELSIITICRNEKDTIEKTIESVIEQTARDKIEYILIDGNSDDGTLDIISKYKDKIDIIVSEQDKGIFDAMNKGIKLSSGKYLNFMNAGDYFVNNQVVERFINMNDGSEFVFGDIIIEYKNGFRFRRKYFMKYLRTLLYFDAINHQASFVKRTLFDAVGLYNTEYKIVSDYFWSLKALFEYKCSYQYLEFPISIFNLYGVSHNKEHHNLHYEERAISQAVYFTKDEILKYKKYRLFYNLYFKKYRYLYYLIRSKLSEKYLYE